MNGKLLFLDIDGTLTEPGYNVPPASALEAIKKAQKNGHRVFLCSGRNLAMLKPLLSYGFDGYVASAGGYVVCDGTVVFDRPMKPEVFELAMATTGLRICLKEPTSSPTASFCASAVSSAKHST